MFFSLKSPLGSRDGLERAYKIKTNHLENPGDWIPAD